MFLSCAPVRTTALRSSNDSLNAYARAGRGGQDIIQNSADTDGIGFSPEASEELRELKHFNYENIYLSPAVKRETDKIRRAFETMVDIYLDDVEKKRQDSKLFTGFLADMAPEYTGAFSPPEIVRDFISGMTDDYLMKRCAERLLPQKMPARFEV